MLVDVSFDVSMWLGTAQFIHVHQDYLTLWLWGNDLNFPSICEATPKIQINTLPDDITTREQSLKIIPILNDVLYFLPIAASVFLL